MEKKTWETTLVIICHQSGSDPEKISYLTTVDNILKDNRYFDPAFWKCEGARAKIVVYYPRNEIKIL